MVRRLALNPLSHTNQSIEDILSLLLESEEGGGGREKHQCKRDMDWLLFRTHLRIEPTIWVCALCPDRESKLLPFSLLGNTPTNCATPARVGCLTFNDVDQNFRLYQSDMTIKNAYSFNNYSRVASQSMF